MRNSIGSPGLARWLLGIGALTVFAGCGGTVLEHKEPGADGGATNAGGQPGKGATTSGSGATAPGKGGGGTVGVGGKGGVAGAVGAGGRIGSGGKTGAGNFPVSPGCSPPLTACSDGCFDLQYSATHCGSCNTTCGGASSCVNGSCQPSSQNCAAGTVYCANFGECLDIKSNPFACGSCSTPCNNGTRCTDGVCDPKSCVDPNATSCPSTGRCSNLSSDSLNCGACGNTCGPADSCQNGKCIPPVCDFGGTTYCPNSGCTDTSVDQFNCGACDKSCLPEGQFDGLAYTCNNGTCGCSFNANKCGNACASAFWYCPPSGFMGQPMDLCIMTARNAYESCACTNCLSQIQACFGNASCINSMDCTLNNPCPSCQPVFSSCTDQNGKLDPIAEKLVQCMNSQCSKMPLPL